jgi:hypothetical protein
MFRARTVQKQQKHIVENKYLALYSFGLEKPTNHVDARAAERETEHEHRVRAWMKGDSGRGASKINK